MRIRISLLALLFTFMAMPAVQAAKKVEIVKIHTAQGDILVYLYERTPIHKKNFLKLAKAGFYDSTTFHRVIEKFMIQGGDPNSKDKDPNNDGSGGPPYTGEANTQLDPEGEKTYTIPAEFNDSLYHKRGALAAARTGDEINPQKRSSGSQFYIVVGRTYTAQELQMYARRLNRTYTDSQIKVYSTIGGTPFLDGNYTVYGEVVSGMDVVDKIVKAPKNGADRPLQDIRMTVTVEKIKVKDLLKKYKYTLPQPEKEKLGLAPKKKSADKK